MMFTPRFPLCFRLAAGLGIAILVFNVAASAAPPTHAPDTNVLGAAGVLEKIPSILSRANETNRTAVTDSPRVQFKKDLAAFAAASSNLAPEKAAAAWLALFDRFWLLPADNGSENQWVTRHGFGPDSSLSLGTVFSAIPGPDTWTPLLQLLKDRHAPGTPLPRRETELRFFAALLVGDMTAMNEAVSNMNAHCEKAHSYMKTQLREGVCGLQAGARLRADSIHPENVLTAFRNTLNIHKDGGAKMVSIDIPDLAALTDAKDAQNLIDQTLAITNVIVTVPAGAETQAIVQRRIIANIDKIQLPQWKMVCTENADGVSLFEALNKKFPEKKNESPGLSVSRFASAPAYEYENNLDQNAVQVARQCYIFGLLATGRRAEAVTFVLTMAPNEMEDVSSSERRPADSATLLSFFDELLRARPELKLWQQYATLALEVGKTNEAVQLILKHEPSTFTSSAHLRNAVETVDAYLTLDEITRAVALIRKVLAADMSRLPTVARHESINTRIQLALSLANMGKLLNEPAWIQEGLMAACDISREEWKSQGQSGSFFYETSQIVQRLINQQDYRTAETFVLDEIAARRKGPTLNSNPYDQESRGIANELSLLIRIYAAAGRPADVVALLDQAPWWGAPDLAAIRNNGCDENKIAPLVAAALHATGRDEDAVRILKPHLYMNPKDDEAYSTLTTIEGSNLIPWLDALYSRDRFEVRPLIWKAWLLMKEGKLDDAEKTARTAITIDPTDGASKAGNRVRGYAVLADILDAKGKKDDAAFFHNVVKSVRMAEDGDQLTEARLITRSLPVYEQAMGIFADAYCIQWRLAERLAARGNIAAAEEHYRIAFERMPEQFGQVANFCFGCEGVFTSDHSRSVAERVLTDLEKKGPKRPQVYYLLGQLRESQERLTEAYACYTKATDMDPGYLDAWKNLGELSEKLFLSQAERDALALRLLNLDPVQHHAVASLGEIYDFKGLWNAVAANQKYAWTHPKSIYPLKASTAKLEEDAKKTGSDSRRRRFDVMEEAYGWQRRIPTPGEAIAENNTVSQIINMMQWDPNDQSNDAEGVAE